MSVCNSWLSPETQVVEKKSCCTSLSIGRGSQFREMWSSSVQSDNTDNAWNVNFNNGNVNNNNRNNNNDVRCVR